MWMKPGMWQYVDYARILAHLSYCGGWLFVACRHVSCAVNVLSVDTREPDCDETLSKCLSRQYLGNVRIWLLTGQNLGHPM